MKFSIERDKIIMVPESTFDGDVVARFNQFRQVSITPGPTIDHNYPPDPRLTGVIFVLPQDNWDR